MNNFKYFSAIIAFVIWASWAYYVNSPKGESGAIISALVQGFFSFLITIFMVDLLSYFYHKFDKNTTKQIMPAIVTIAMTSVCLFIAHYIIGTTYIFYTILPNIIVAFVFCLFTLQKLHGENK